MNIRQTAKRRKQLANRKSAIRGLSPIPESERHNHNLTELQNNAYVQLNQKVYLVEGISRYQEHNWKLTKTKKFQSYELDLFCLNNSERLNIEWEKDDRIEASMTTEEIKLNRLSDKSNIPIKSQALEGIVDAEKSIYMNGKEFHYDDDWAAKYYRDEQSEGIGVRFYEFVADDGICVTIEEWMDGPPKEKETDFEYEVFLSQELDPDSIEILALGNQ